MGLEYNFAINTIHKIRNYDFEISIERKIYVKNVIK